MSFIIHKYDGQFLTNDNGSTDVRIKLAEKLKQAISSKENA